MFPRTDFFGVGEGGRPEIIEEERDRNGSFSELDKTHQDVLVNHATLENTPPPQTPHISKGKFERLK